MDIQYFENGNLRSVAVSCELFKTLARDKELVSRVLSHGGARADTAEKLLRFAADGAGSQCSGVGGGCAGESGVCSGVKVETVCAVGPVESPVGAGGATGAVDGRSGLGPGACGAGGNECDMGVGTERVVGDGDFVSGSGDAAGSGCDIIRGKHYERNRRKKEKARLARLEMRAKQDKIRRPWRGGYCETLVSERPVSTPSSCPGLSSAATSQSLVDAEAAARESLARRRVVENELAMAKAKAQIASYADVEKSKAIAELKIARIAQWNNEARMKSQKSWADYKRSLESSPVPSFKASDLPSAASAGEYWWKQQCLKSKEMEEQIKHLEAVLKASMPYVSPEGLEKMREVPDPEPIIDPEFEALKRAHRELAAAEGLDGYDSGDDIGYDLFMPPGSL